MVDRLDLPEITCPAVAQGSEGPSYCIQDFIALSVHGESVDPTDKIIVQVRRSRFHGAISKILCEARAVSDALALRRVHRIDLGTTDSAIASLHEHSKPKISPDGISKRVEETNR